MEHLSETQIMYDDGNGTMDNSYPTKYSYAGAKSHKFSLAMVRTIIDRLLSNQENGLYAVVERHLSEPGGVGRVSWDHCMATQAVLEADADTVTGGTGELNAMVNSQKLTLPTLGNELIKVLRSANFQVERGRITGVVEEV